MLLTACVVYSVVSDVGYEIDNDGIVCVPSNPQVVLQQLLNGLSCPAGSNFTISKGSVEAVSLFVIFSFTFLKRPRVIETQSNAAGPIKVTSSKKFYEVAAVKEGATSFRTYDVLKRKPTPSELPIELPKPIGLCVCLCACMRACSSLVIHACTLPLAHILVPFFSFQQVQWTAAPYLSSFLPLSGKGALFPYCSLPMFPCGVISFKSIYMHCVKHSALPGVFHDFVNDVIWGVS